jgi:hypothetical protein
MRARSRHVRAWSRGGRQCLPRRLPALAIVEQDGPHAVAFPCRRVVGAWIAAENNKWTEVRRTGVVFAGKNELRHIRRASSSVSCCLNMGGSQWNGLAKRRR